MLTGSLDAHKDVAKRLLSAARGQEAKLGLEGTMEVIGCKMVGDFSAEDCLPGFVMYIQERDRPVRNYVFQASPGLGDRVNDGFSPDFGRLSTASLMRLALILSYPRPFEASIDQKPR